MLLLTLLCGAQAAVAADLRNGEARAVLNGVEHWYRVAGAEHSTTPLVIVHGGPGGSVYTYERTIGPRLEAFTTIIYYDQRGSGRSAAPADTSDYAMATLVADLEALRRHLGIERVRLLGFSFGGQLALEYAVRHPERVERLILQATPDGDYHRLAQVQTWGFQSILTGEARQQADRLAREPLASPFDRMNAIWSLASQQDVDRFLFRDPAAAQLNRQLWAQSGARNTGLMARVIFAESRTPSLAEELARAAMPALVLVGQYDRNVGVDMARDLAARLPRGVLATVLDSAHFPEMDQPDLYLDRVRRFLTSAGGDI